MTINPKLTAAWPIVPLGSVVKFLSGGTPSMAEAKYWNGDIPWVSSGEMTQRKIHSTELGVTEDGANEGSKRIPARTVLVVVRGMSLAKEFRVAITARDATFNQDLKALIPSKKLLPEFLFYYLLSQNHPIRDSASESAHGTKKLDTQTLEEWPVPLPPSSVQKKMVAILSTYDDLIENNQRRIALLEKMAEEIYREWFVRLRYPGHEKAKKVKGVPEGWKVAELKEVAIEASRSARPGSHLDERFYLPLELLNTRQMIPGGHHDYTEAQSSLVTFEKGDMLFGAMRPYQHKVAIAPFAGITRTTCFVIRPKMPQVWSWLFLTLFQQTSVDYATMICNGADRPYVVWNKGMERMKLLCPDDALLVKFEEVARPILDSISSMYFVQLKLKECRDMLLPRLISGKLSVENLDIHQTIGMRDENLSHGN